jgi:hypothetical protein
MVNQAGKLVIDQFANRGARHQHPLINVKLMAAEPRFVGQIGDGNTLVHAANHPLNDAVFSLEVRRAVRISSGISSGR